MRNRFVQIDQFILDVTLSETHKFSSEVTDYPVEEGGSFSDNIRPKPMELTIEGLVSNTPLQSNIATQNQVPGNILSQPSPEVSALVGIIGGAITSATGGSTIQYLRSDQAYEYLRAIWLARKGVTIRTSLGVFENMALVDLNIPRDPSTGDALKFTASFQQIEVLSNERLSSVPGRGDKNRRGHKTGTPNVGAQILWRRGVIIGGYPIYDTKYVVLEYNKTSKIIEWRYVKQQPITITALIRPGDPPADTVITSSPYRTNSEVSGFFSLYGKEENRALTPREVQWLTADLKRDAEARRKAQDTLNPITSVGTDEDALRKELADRRAARQARSFASGSNPYDPDILRRPLQDPSKLQRSAMNEQGNGADPMGISGKRQLNQDSLSLANTNRTTNLLP